MTLLDHLGNPVALPTRRQSETENNPWLRGQASHPARKIAPQRLRRVLDAAEQGDISGQSDLMEDMEEMDAHLHAELSKRRRALLTLPWSVEPPPNASASERKQAKQVMEMVQAIPDFEDVILDLADAIGKGFACLELAWQRNPDGWQIQKVEHRPQRWFQFGVGDGVASNAIRLRNNSVAGEDLWPFGWIAHTHRSRSGWAVRTGLMRTLAWPFLYKQYATEDFAEFLEIHGLPLRLGTYPGSATEQERADLFRAVRDLGHNASGIIPDTMAISFEEASRSGSGNLWQDMIRWAEQSISKAVLGGTLTSQADGKTSTNALGQIHDDVRKDLLQSDGRQIASTLTRQLVWPLAALNASNPDPSRPPVFRFDFRETQDLREFAIALPPLVAAGLKIPTAWVRENLAIPEPKEGDDVLEIKAAPRPTPLTAMARAPTTCPHCASLSASPQAETTDLADRYVTKGIELAGGAMPALMDPVRALLARSRSLEEFRDGLFAVFPDMDSSRLEVILAQAMIAAHLGGRAEIIDGE
ncbi:MAG: DUF935 domain-containing protein [Magnetococcales bacterium]|nr:DUF935 domain-containing protein [Magnetococcales bacterium]